jgi:hypothetical protein
MTLKALAAVLVGLALAAPAYAQSDDDVPPNAVEDQSSFSTRQIAEPPMDTGISYVFEQLSVPAEAQQIVPLAPRTSKGTEPDLVAAPTTRK